MGGSAAGDWSVRFAAGHARHASAAGPPEKATTPAAETFWCCVVCHVMWTGPLLNESGARPVRFQYWSRTRIRNFTLLPICGVLVTWRRGENAIRFHVSGGTASTG